MAYTNGRPVNSMIDGYTKQQANQAIDDRSPNPNLLINGHIDVHQRVELGEYIHTTGYCADRWRAIISKIDSKVETMNHFCETLNDTEKAQLGAENFLGLGIDDTSNIGWGVQLVQSIEVDYKTVLGQELTFQMTSRCDSKSQNRRIAVEIGAYTGDDFISYDTNYFDMTDDWGDYSCTFKVPVDSEDYQAINPSLGSNKRLYLMIWLVRGENNSDVQSQLRIPEMPILEPIQWYVTKLKLEHGGFATKRQHEPFASELIKCQRYFYKNTPIQQESFGVAHTSTVASARYYFPTEMRTSPSIKLEFIKQGEVGGPYGYGREGDVNGRINDYQEPYPLYICENNFTARVETNINMTRGSTIVFDLLSIEADAEL